MNITAILEIAALSILFLVVEIILVYFLIEFIRDKDLIWSCVLGLILIMFCLLVLLTFINISPGLKPDLYSDCQLQQKVIETKDTSRLLLVRNISTDANFENFRKSMEE